METKTELVKAIIAVMNEVSNIEKNLTVGTGASSYKGVSDKDVKHIVGKAMASNGLVMLPIEVDIKTTIERWEEDTQYGKKIKQSVFADANCKYLLLHTSGESQVIAGAGHGVDSQDKASGKSLTYAMKGAILQTFMIPTGEIDDTDKTHSDDIPVPQNTTTQPELPWLNEKDVENWNKAIEGVKSGARTVAGLRKFFKISKDAEAKLNEHLPK